MTALAIPIWAAHETLWTQAKWADRNLQDVAKYTSGGLRVESPFTDFGGLNARIVLGQHLSLAELASSPNDPKESSRVRASRDASRADQPKRDFWFSRRHYTKVCLNNASRHRLPVFLPLRTTDPVPAQTSPPTSAQTFGLAEPSFAGGTTYVYSDISE